MQEVAHVGALQQLVMRTVSLTDWTPLNECRYAALQTATKREKKKPMWGYVAAASAAVSMKSLTEARRRMLAVMAWSNLIWCLLCVLWGTCWNSLSTYESHTSVERGGITWHSVWAKKKKKEKKEINNALPWFVHPHEEMFYPLLAALLAVDGNFCWTERETSNCCGQMGLVTHPCFQPHLFPTYLADMITHL